MTTLNASSGSICFRMWTRSVTKPVHRRARSARFERACCTVEATTDPACSGHVPATGEPRPPRNIRRSGEAMSLQTDLETIAATAAAHAVDVDRGTFPKATLRALADAGLLGLISSASVGGMSLGMVEASFVVERLARECGSTAMVVAMHYAATAVIEQHGSDEVRRAIAA